MRKSTSGFTIVELLTVIVVIAILATITIVAFNGVQTRAQASAIISSLKANEKGFKAFQVISSASDWWLDTDASLSGSGTGNPKVVDIIANQPELRNLLSDAPSTSGLNTPNKWFYDNDGDVYNGCSASNAGAGFVLFNPQNTALVQMIDSQQDDGNLACGKIRMAGSNFIYGLN